MEHFIGIEIGGTKLQLVRGDDQASIMERHRFTVDPAQGAKGIQKKIQEGVDRMRIHHVSAIGVGFGGPVDHGSGKIRTSYQVEGWEDFVIREWLEKLTGIPVWVDNDANVAALGESLFGAGKNSSHLLYVTLGSGVGAGVVVNKQIYHGARCTEAEFGHIRLDKSGKTVESSCSGWAVDQKIKSYAAVHPESLLRRLTKGMDRGEACVLVEALGQNDEAAAAILDQTADDFSYALSHAVHLMSPQTVILGGGLSLTGEPFRKLVEEKLSGYLMDVLRPGPAIVLSSLKEDAVPVGALALASNKLFSA
jgi:glucokinase